jgi:hypothetical protein
VYVGPCPAKLVKEDALLSSDERHNFSRESVERDLGNERLRHRVLVGNIVLEQLGRQGPEVVVVHGLIASWIR